MCYIMVGNVYHWVLRWVRYEQYKYIYIQSPFTRFHLNKSIECRCCEFAVNYHRYWTLFYIKNNIVQIFPHPLEENRGEDRIRLELFELKHPAVFTMPGQKTKVHGGYFRDINKRWQNCSKPRSWLIAGAKWGWIQTAKWCTDKTKKSPRRKSHEF